MSFSAFLKEIAKHRSGFLRNPFLYPSHGKVAREIGSRNLIREMDHGMVRYDRRWLAPLSQCHALPTVDFSEIHSYIPRMEKLPEKLGREI